MNIVITGASQGIGYATVIELAKYTEHTIVCIARNKQKLVTLKNEVESINPKAKIIPIAFDLTKISQNAEDLSKSIKGYIDKIDILINNAGLLYAKPLTDLGLEEIRNMVEVNYFAPMLLIKQLIPFMGNSSHVLNISSMGGFQGSVKFPGLSVYASSKAALASLTENLAEENKKSGISFNCLALGATDTEMLREAFPDYKAPLTAQAMAGFIAYFAVHGHKYFNGKILPVSLSTP
jgi:short-subunit dehydrogenase